MLCLCDGLCYEDGDDAIGFVLVRLIPREGRYRDGPEALPFGCIDDLAHPHRIGCGLVANFDIRLRLQVVIPKRISRRAAVRRHNDIMIAVHGSHDWGLADRACLPAAICHNDDGQIGIPQG